MLVLGALFFLFLHLSQEANRCKFAELSTILVKNYWLQIVFCFVFLNIEAWTIPKQSCIHSPNTHNLARQNDSSSSDLCVPKQKKVNTDKSRLKIHMA